MDLRNEKMKPLRMYTCHMMIEDESRATDKVYLLSVLRVRTVNDHSSCATLKYSHNQHEDFF